MRDVNLFIYDTKTFFYYYYLLQKRFSAAIPPIYRPLVLFKQREIWQVTVDQENMSSPRLHGSFPVSCRSETPVTFSTPDQHSGVVVFSTKHRYVSPRCCCWKLDFALKPRAESFHDMGDTTRPRWRHLLSTSRLHGLVFILWTFGPEGKGCSWANCPFHLVNNDVASNIAAAEPLSTLPPQKKFALIVSF